MYGGRLAPGQLAALARLGALGDLDLELVGPGEVRGGHAEPRRRDLLDPRVAPAAVGVRHVPRRVLAALAGVRGATGPLDADRQRLVGLGRQRPDAHRRDDEPAGDRPRVLDVVEVERGRAAGGRASSSRARRRRAGRASAADSATSASSSTASRLGGVVGGSDPTGPGSPWRSRREQVRLAVGPEAGEARVGQPRLAARRASGQGQRGRAPTELPLAECREGRPARPRRGHREAPGDDVRREVDRVDERAADVARRRR